VNAVTPRTAGRLARRTLVAACAVVSLVACGADTAEISPSAATELDTVVAEVREAVDAGDVERARELLSALRTTVVELTTTGGVTSDRALEINQAIAALDEQLGQVTTTTEAPATTTEAPTTTRAPATTTTVSTTTTDAPERPGKGKGRDDEDD
jgi:hypothetical protein